MRPLITDNFHVHKTKHWRAIQVINRYREEEALQRHSNSRGNINLTGVRAGALPLPANAQVMHITLYDSTEYSQGLSSAIHRGTWRAM